jgi:hypothetical protein
MPILSFGDAKSKGGNKKKLKPDPDTEVYSGPEVDQANVHTGPLGKIAHIPPSSTVKRSKSPPLPTKPPTGPVEEASIIWWSDAEITGHLGLDPDDDGYGINGIGFKPTPAIAAARSVKRRKQVDEWRSRELREERRRRAEGRRRAGGMDPGRGTGAGIAKRTVRFAS